MKVKCIETSFHKDLYLGREYEVDSENSKYYFVKQPCVIGYAKELFEIINEDKKEEVFNVQNATVSITGIDFDYKDTPCMFAFEKLRVINPERFASEYCLQFGTGMNGVDFSKDVKDEGIKVRCIKNNKGQNVSEIELTLNKEYLVLEDDGERYYVENNLGEKRGYFKTRFEIIKEDKMEEIRVVRKLEDLDGLENGMGATAVYDEVNKRVRIRTKEEYLGIGIAHSDEYSDLDGFLTVMKVIGFKFEYKPLRTIDQVKAEMLLKCKEFKFNSKNYFINYVQQDKRYYVSYDCFNNILGALYFDKETANEYCNELNEILKNN